MNLRPALTSVGPLLPQIGEELGIGQSRLGFLGSLPLLAYAAFSPLTQKLSRRFGADTTVFAALTVLVCGIILRSYTGVSRPADWHAYTSRGHCYL